MSGIFSFIGIIISLSILIIIHEAGHFLTGKWLGFYIKEFGFGYPPRLWGKKIKETIYSFNWIPFGGFIRFFDSRIDGDGGIGEEKSFGRQKIWKRAVVMSAGILVNFVVGWMLISSVYMVGMPEGLLITQVLKGSVAESNGIKSGDLIVDFGEVDGFIKFLDEQKGEEVVLNIKRQEKGFSIKFIPPIDEINGGRFGVFLSKTGIKRQGFLGGFTEGFKVSVLTVYYSVVGLIELIIKAFTNVGVLRGVVGPVGIATIAVETSKLGFVYFIQIMALISLGLAAFNIFPIPGLDGGRLFMILIEKIKGSPIAMKTEMYIFGSSFVFLLIVALIITVKDIAALF